MAEPEWAAVYGVAQSRTQRKRLSSSSSSILKWRVGGGEIAWTLLLPSSIIDVNHSYKNVRSGKATLAAEVDPEEADTELLQITLPTAGQQVIPSRGIWAMYLQGYHKA